jgi:Xaa-Pro aminopeptidase
MEYKADVLVLSALDQIAWTFNIRGSDVEYNPVVIAYALILKDEARLFLEEGKLSKPDQDVLSRDAAIFPYEDFATQLKDVAKKKVRVLVDKATVSRWIVNHIADPEQIIARQSPVTPMKACKNETELEGFRRCHIRDGVAMVRFLHWLENAVAGGGITEISAAEKLLEFRKEQDLFQGQSFAPISAYGAHGAIVHYSASSESDIELKPEGIYLIDSGAQYLDGTTDITRTLALGEPTEEQKDRFTRVLKGHIDLAMSRFPEGTTGIQLDTIARKPLWDIRRNYGHGTGHGIGVFLNVHEGPQAISYYRGIGEALKPGMICSNEPGFYKAGEYGIRIENLVEVIPDASSETGDQKFYAFSSATLCPIETRLIDKSLLTATEIAYFNDYHKRVKEVLSPLLDEDDKYWLERVMQKI